MAFSDQASSHLQHFQSSALGKVVMSFQVQGKGTLTLPVNGRSIKTCVTFLKHHT